MAGEVIGIYDGNYLSEGPMYAGLAKSFGPTAVFRVEEVDILVATHNLQILERMQFSAFGMRIFLIAGPLSAPFTKGKRKPH